jgi:hypothetical protein
VCTLLSSNVLFYVHFEGGNCLEVAFSIVGAIFLLNGGAQSATYQISTWGIPICRAHALVSEYWQTIFLQGHVYIFLGFHVVLNLHCEGGNFSDTPFDVPGGVFSCDGVV